MHITVTFPTHWSSIVGIPIGGYSFFLFALWALPEVAKVLVGDLDPLAVFWHIASL